MVTSDPRIDADIERAAHETIKRGMPSTCTARTSSDTWRRSSSTAHSACGRAAAWPARAEPAGDQRAADIAQRPSTSYATPSSRSFSRCARNERSAIANSCGLTSS